MGEIFDRFEVEPQKGADITIGTRFPEIFVSDRDEIICYLGICLNEDNDERRMRFMYPYYMQGKHSDDKKIADNIYGFYRLADGCIVLDNYVDNKYQKDYLYKRLDTAIRFPCPDTYYAVFNSCEEDDTLSREVFGLCYGELKALLEVYAKILGTYNDYAQFPRLTRSVRSTNFCDMTDIFIPEQFPYIAFDNSGYEFSHVSLWGFYRHIQLLTQCRMNSAISRLFLKEGLSEEILKRLFNIGHSIFSQEKVTKRLFL